MSGEDKPTIKQTTLFDEIGCLYKVVVEIENKIFGENPNKPSEETKDTAEPANIIIRARNRIMRCVVKLRRVDGALASIDKK